MWGCPFCGREFAEGDALAGHCLDEHADPDPTENGVLARRQTCLPGGRLDLGRCWCWCDCWWWESVAHVPPGTALDKTTLFEHWQQDGGVAAHFLKHKAFPEASHD